VSVFQQSFRKQTTGRTAYRSDQRARPPVQVTVDNFVRAESDTYFGNAIEEAGSLGIMHHRRKLIPVDRQLVVRPNRDTLYSDGVFDLEAGAVNITLPHAGNRFMSLMVLDEDHYVAGVFYGAGDHTFARDQFDTRYVLLAVRTLVDPHDASDMEQAHALQDRILVRQERVGTFDVPTWDAASQKRVRDALKLLGETLPETKRTFGGRDDVDPVRHLIGTAIGWGGNPEKEACHLNVTPARNDGVTPYRLKVRDVPVDGFWSISVYNARGYFEPNERNAYTVNNVTARRGADASITVQFGGCEQAAANCLPIMKGWNYMVRLYRPRDEILTGEWAFPKAQPVS
jgi:hypothetical protein